MLWTTLILSMIILSIGAQVVDVPSSSDEKTATFAAGCFWCIEADLEKIDGVREVVSGYAGGVQENPTYKKVSSGTTNHVEAVQVYYDSTKVSYAEIVEFFWLHMDPTDDGGQFADRGRQYRSAIFYHNKEQKQIAEHSKQALQESGIYQKPIVTEIRPFTTFYPAEDYHQDYAKKNPIRYNTYRFFSGRDRHIKKVKKRAENKKQNSSLSRAELRKTLTPLQRRGQACNSGV